MTAGKGDQRRDLTLTRFPSGHRAVSPIGCRPSGFRLSEGLAARFPSFVEKPTGAWMVNSTEAPTLQDCW
eukprot:8278499-Pyramimonas_sp.AAC.1